MTTRAQIELNEANVWADAQLARPLIASLRRRRNGTFLLVWLVTLAGMSLVGAWMGAIVLLVFALQWLTGDILVAVIVPMLLVTLCIAATTTRTPRIIWRLTRLQARLEQEEVARER